MNPIKKAYEKFDDAVMSGVNKGVRAWNWTTGKTKTDLANSLLIGGAVMNSASSLVTTPINIAFVYFFKRNNDRIEEAEKISSETKTLDPLTEAYKNYSYPLLGSLGLLISASGAIIAYNSEKEDSIVKCSLTSIGEFMWGASFYVMRANPLPPRKSAFSRAKDKLSEKLSSIPQTEPVAVPVEANREYSNYNRLEDALK